MANSIKELKRAIEVKVSEIADVAKGSASSWIQTKAATRPWVVVGTSFAGGLVLGLVVKLIVF